MIEQSQADGSGAVFRVDKFSVPQQARDAFMDRVRQTHELLRQQPGFVRDYLLERESGSSEFNLVTIVEWQGQEAIARARTAIKAMHERQGFDPQALIRRLNIRADIGNYRPF